MRIKGKKFGRKTNKTLKFVYSCRYCKAFIQSCHCWKEETDEAFFEGKRESIHDRRDSLKRRPGYKEYEERKRIDCDSEEEGRKLEKRKPQFNRKYHKPFVKAEKRWDNDWHYPSDGKKTMKSKLQREIKQEATYY